MDKCPACGYMEPTKNKSQHTAMNEYVIDHMSKDDVKEGAKVINSDERYITIKEVKHRRADLPFGAPEKAPEKVKSVIPNAAPSDVIVHKGPPINVMPKIEESKPVMTGSVGIAGNAVIKEIAKSQEVKMSETAIKEIGK